ncbi:184_t:CDS:1, partial [Funneliformis mosseae]
RSWLLFNKLATSAFDDIAKSFLLVEPYFGVLEVVRGSLDEKEFLSVSLSLQDIAY